MVQSCCHDNLSGGVKLDSGQPVICGSVVVGVQALLDLRQHDVVHFQGQLIDIEAAKPKISWNTFLGT